MKQTGLGKWTSTSLVVGNMIGAGIFMTPAILAPYGGISLVGWLMSVLGALFIAILFSRLSQLFPGLKGGPYAFTLQGMGKLPAFLVAWGYWVSVWTTNAALAVAFVSYLGVFIPALDQQPLIALSTAVSVIWLLTWFNTTGIGKVGKLSLLTTLLKVAPILVIGLVGLFSFNPEHFIPFNPGQHSPLSAVAITTTLTFFSFLGIESATIPAENVANPDKNIPFATRWGTVIAAIVYILSSVAVMGLIPPTALQSSSAPFADAAIMLWGVNARYLVAAAAMISVFGALNGWILIQGQMPQAIAKDGLFPTLFAKENKHGTPLYSLVISSILASVLILMNYSSGLLEVFKFMILVSTVSVLIPYLFCAVSYARIMHRSDSGTTKARVYLPLAIITLAFSMYALIGSGADSVFWGLLFLMLGIPVYLWNIKRQHD